jgi:hypothetical protein
MPATPPMHAGELVLEQLGDPQFLTADGHALYWVDAETRSLQAWSEGDAGTPRTITDGVAPLADLIQPFAVAGGAVYLLTQIVGEHAPRVERVAASGGPRKVLSNAIPSVLGVAASDGHVFVALDVDPPRRSMLGEAFEVGADRKLATLGSTNGRPRAIAVRHGELVVASALGLSRHRPKASVETLVRDEYCGPGLTVGGDRVHFTRTDEPSVASMGKTAEEERGAPGITLPAFAVSLHQRGSVLYVGTRASEPPKDAGSASMEHTIARALHEADESVRERRRLRALYRIDVTDGKVTPIATFDPPATSFAVTDHALYVASPGRNGSLYRLPL